MISITLYRLKFLYSIASTVLYHSFLNFACACVMALRYECACMYHKLSDIGFFGLVYLVI